MSLQKETKIYKTFILSTSLTTALALSAVFFGISIRTRALIHDELLSHAKAHFDTIVKARTWNTQYGGVYVEKREGVESSPFMDTPDIETKDGRTFTLKNPATMTREISNLFHRSDKSSFKITSLKPINPLNQPDEFEQKALKMFEQGQKEVHQLIKRNNQTYLRYMAPLYVTEDCLKCHAKHGYRVGDVRGGISVNLAIDAVQKKLDKNFIIIIISGLITTSLLLGLIWHFTARLINKIAEARKQIEEMAVTDDLTKLFNRRHVISSLEQEADRARRLGNDLCCIMLDIDNFKSINDRYGHLAGDKVLKEVAHRIRSEVRKYDIVGRYGGEEFIIISPEIDLETTKMLAERIRVIIKERSIEEMHITASLGISALHATDTSVDDLIRRADDALYRAKSAGKDCVRHE